MNRGMIARELVAVSGLLARRDEPDFDVSRNWAVMDGREGIEYINRRRSWLRVFIDKATGRWDIYGEEDTVMNAGRLRKVTPENVRKLLGQAQRLYLGSDRQAAEDEYMLTRDYRDFVKNSVKKYYGKYRDGVAKFPGLGLEVSFGSNETKFYFKMGNYIFGRAWSAEEADKVLALFRKAQQMLD